MRVKRLEVQGFKSFKDKTVIHFDHSITGIVGPNGCGKSNIVDAFFWVMGEQSYKHMRGTGADDLIFNGSTKYSPMGMAEATLVMETEVPDLENGPAGASSQDIPVHLKTKEISVTRRVYRSGEGEYFINGVPARLKDIHELFMDTGVGAKGYSVIEQGQIGKIVNSKPEERRLLIEEAAGIAKYKARKKESLRKMEATHANLSRLNDVIQEIERNLGSLERQAQKARQYRKYKDELFDKEITWGRRKTLVLRQKLESLQKSRVAMEQDLVGLRAELQVSENSIETDRIEQLTDSKLAEQLQSSLQVLSEELSHSRSALDLSRRRQGDLTSQVQSLDSEREELSHAILAAQERLTTLEEESQVSEAHFQKAAQDAKLEDEQARSLRQQFEVARRALDQSKREQMTGISKHSEITSKIASLAGKIESTHEQAERLAEQISQQEERVQSARDEATKAKEASEQVRTKKDELVVERKTAQSLVQEQEQAVRQAERTRDDASKKTTQLKSRLNSLEELAAAYEGFGDGPKAALDWVKSSGRAGELKSVAEMLEVTSGYEAALEGWFESRLENLISDDPELAHQALEQLKTAKQGRATIQVTAPQNSAPAKELKALHKALTEAGFEVEGELSKFVKINEAYADKISYLVDNVLVVKSLAPAAKLIAEGKLPKFANCAVVSLDGEALDASGCLRGGSTESNQAASVLGRKRIIAELKTQASEAEAALTQLEVAVVEARESLETAREKQQALLAQIQALEIEGAALERDVHQMSRGLKDIENQLGQLKRQAEISADQVESSTQEKERLEEALVELNSRKVELEEQIASAEAALTSLDEGSRAKDSELQTLRVQEASLRERAGSLRRELDTARAVIADRKRRMAEVERVLERASRDRDQFTGGDVELETKIEELTRTLGQTREQLSAAKDRLEQSNAKLNASLDRIKELHSDGNQRTSESTQLAIDIEKLSGEYSHLIQNLDEKYGQGCLERPMSSPIQEEMTEPVITQEMSAEDELRLGEEVERLRERIRRLGEVNVMAIEEYETTKARFDYLQTERSDLHQSIKNLEEAIEHINKTSEERFKKAFDSIAERFERLFPIIFGGGQAKLSLVYPENSKEILDAGVDILAQPPGKKVSNITLLSGGEKALTAVCMIFAIFMVKPSPFCLLDEVDAPLDDANIGKFNALLREMSVKSQFILITHNKKTMELNDTLYGVTMEEPGVSKMVSIEMR